MKKLRILFTITLILLISVSSLFAVPAKQQAITVKQSNGKLLTLLLQGDERVHWARTLDGYSLLKNENGDYVYAVLDERGNMVASSVLASNVEERNAEELAFVSTLNGDLRFSSDQVANKLNKWNAPQGSPLRTSSFPTVGTDSLLVILVDFADLPFTYTNQDFVNLVSQTNYNGYGSVKDYYLDNSNNQFNMAIRVVGPYTLAHNMAYYGGNDDENTNYQNFVRDVVDLVDADVDFSHFDNDNDGEVDGFHIIFAGTPESSTGNEDEIWPHRWSLWMYQVYKDNTLIWTYACSAEKRSATQMDGIGTMCHEFGHVLGLPDNYDTDYSESNGNSVTTGYYDLMASGSYNNNGDTPPYLSVGEKIITNWVTIDTLTSSRANASIRAVNGTTDTGYYIGIDNSDEFFILEMRKKTGWDLFLPGEGLLVYHGDRTKINAWLDYGTNEINITPSERGWFIEPSTGVTADGVNAYAPFGSVSNINSFAPNSPNTPHLNNGTSLNISVTNIHYTSTNTMAFDFGSVDLVPPSVEISNVDTFYYNGSLAAQWTYTKNETCEKYYAARYQDSVIENFATSNNMTLNEVLAYLINNDYITEYTSDQTVAYYTTPNTNYEIVVWAVGYGDTVFIKQTFNIPLTQGGTGNAVATINVSNITSSSADIDITINDQTFYYYEVQGQTAAFNNLNLTTDALVLQYCLDNNWSKTYDPMSFTMTELEPNTEYKVYVFPFNANEVQGPTAVVTFTTQELVLPNVEISDVDTFYYNGSLVSEWSYTMNETCEKYYAARYQDNVIENFATSNNMSLNEVLAYLINNDYITESTANDTVAYYTTPNTDYEIVVWAIGNGDTVFIKKIYNITISQGGTGLATANISVSNITSTTADVSVTKNSETFYYYYIQGTTTAFTNNNLLTANDIVQYCITNNWTKTYDNLSLTMTDLIPNREYTLWAIPFNANETMGTPHHITFTTLDTASTEPDPCVITINLEQTICEGESYMGQTQTGTYYDTIHSNTCDTVVILTLNVMPTYNIVIHDTASWNAGAEEQIDMTQLNLTSMYGCDSTVTIYTHYWTSSLEKVEDVISVNIIPNPAKDYVTVFAEGLKNKETLTIVDELGRIRYSCLLHQGDNKIMINVTDYSSGVYYIRIGNTSKKLIIK